MQQAQMMLQWNMILEWHNWYQKIDTEAQKLVTKIAWGCNHHTDEGNVGKEMLNLIKMIHYICQGIDKKYYCPSQINGPHPL